MIIGIAGVKHAGKNEVAKIIKEEFGEEYIVKEWSFAYKLKKSAAAALGIETDDPVEWANEFKESGIIKIQDTFNLFIAYWLKSEYTISGREYLQYYGTEAHREVFGDDFWVDQTINEIKDNYAPGSSTEERLDLITDVRFPNEAEGVWDELGKMIRVNRHEVENQGDTHASEKPLPADLIDVELFNNGTLQDLRLETIEVISGLI